MEPDKTECDKIETMRGNIVCLLLQNRGWIEMVGADAIPEVAEGLVRYILNGPKKK